MNEDENHDVARQLGNVPTSLLRWDLGDETNSRKAYFIDVYSLDNSLIFLLF